jgi:hypothetical protein
MIGVSVQHKLEQWLTDSPRLCPLSSSTFHQMGKSHVPVYTASQPECNPGFCFLLIYTQLTDIHALCHPIYTLMQLHKKALEVETRTPCACAIKIIWANWKLCACAALKIMKKNVCGDAKMWCNGLCCKVSIFHVPSTFLETQSGTNHTHQLRTMNIITVSWKSSAAVVVH